MKPLLIAEFLYLAYFTVMLLLSLPTEMEAAASECKTTSGTKCIFPFQFSPIDEFKGRWYNECTWEWAFDRFRNGRAWCGTRESAFWNWGDCGEGCPIPGRTLSPHHNALIIPFVTKD